MVQFPFMQAMKCVFLMVPTTCLPRRSRGMVPPDRCVPRQRPRVLCVPWRGTDGYCAPRTWRKHHSELSWNGARTEVLRYWWLLQYRGDRWANTVEQLEVRNGVNRNHCNHKKIESLRPHLHLLRFTGFCALATNCTIGLNFIANQLQEVKKNCKQKFGWM